MLLKRIDKSLSGSFVDDSILIEFIRDRAGVTVFWDIFDIHLPFHSDFGRRSFRIAADSVFDPIDFFIGVTIWMRGQRAMGFVT